MKKIFDKSEAWLIIELDKEGKSTSEIAKEVGRTKASIQSFLEREHRDHRYTKKFDLNNVDKPDVKKTEKAPDQRMRSLMVAGVKVGETMAETIEGAESPVVSTVRTKELQPREMIKKLYDMGYRIENNQLVCYQKVVVKVNDIINGQ